MDDLKPRVPEPEQAIQEPPPPEDEPEIEEAPARVLDPALLYFIIMALALLGLNNIAPEIRYTALWTVLTILGVLFIINDKISLAAPTMRDVVIGVGFGLLVGLPLLAIGATQLKLVSLNIFKGISEPAIFQMLAFTMPLAEGLYFRAAFQNARGAIFAGAAAGIWALALFFPKFDVVNNTLLAVVLGVAFIFINALYSYVRQRFGFFASWTCQIVINLLLLFVVRFA